jgi:hypothetical protein
VKYQWDKIFPFENLKVDIKEILDKKTLPNGLKSILQRE